jgi:putative pyoverdin transport system ATP-binding/permease protein
VHKSKLFSIPIFDERIMVTLKPILKLAVIAALSETVLAALLFAVADLSAAQPRDKYFIWIIIALAVYALLGRMFKHRLHTLFEERIAKIRLAVMDLIRMADLRSFEQIGPEYLYTALTSDIRAVSELSHTVAATAYALFLMVGILLYLAILSEYAFFLTLAVGGSVAVFYSRNQEQLKQLIAQVRERETRLFQSLTDVLDGFKQLRLNTKKNDAFFFQNIQPQIAQIRQLRLQTAQHAVVNYVVTSGLWIALVLTPVLLVPLMGVVVRDKLMTFLGLILFIPTNYLVEEIPRIIMAFISIQRIQQLEQILATLKTETVTPVSPTALRTFKTLVYQEITFHYETQDGQAFALGPLNLVVRPGEIIFLTGGNGSGKTTLLKVITGLYPIASGQIVVNAQTGALQPYRRLFAVVFSGAHLFDWVYGCPEVKPEQVAELLALLQLDEKVQFQDGRFSPLDLSTGQQKRLALLVALLEDKPIYVFDEWAADQDPYFRELFYRTILPDLKARGKTVVAVTHDDRYFAVADRLLKLEEGRLEHG